MDLTVVGVGARECGDRESQGKEVMSQAKKSSQSAIQLTESGQNRVVCTTSEEDRFVLDEADAFRACLRMSKEDREAREIQWAATALKSEIVSWCNERSSEVSQCWLSLRSDDCLILFVCKHDDEEGSFHHAMCDLDVRMHETYPFRLYFLMLRNSERDGVHSFLDVASGAPLYLTNA